MKLVELLAKELSEWQEGAHAYAQDGNRKTYAWTGTPEFYGEDWLIAENAHIHHGENTVLYPQLADDYRTSVVTKAQWQAERDRQNGGDWKRHRGGKCPVHGDQMVEVKLRDGDIQQAYARCFAWPYDSCDTYANITKYRVISQPQAEEVEVKNTNMGTLSYTVDIDTSPAMQALNELSAKWDQVESPFKWRDTVNELNAYIEEFTRERDELINRLAEEGFALIPAMTPVMGVADVDMGDWRNLQVGDIIECSEDGAWNSSWKGKHVTVAEVEPVDYDGDLPIRALYGDLDDWGRGYKFIRRP